MDPLRPHECFELIADDSAEIGACKWVAETRGQYPHTLCSCPPATWPAGVDVAVSQGVWAGPALRVQKLELLERRRRHPRTLPCTPRTHRQELTCIGSLGLGQVGKWQVCK